MILIHLSRWNILRISNKLLRALVMHCWGRLPMSSTQITLWTSHHLILILGIWNLLCWWSNFLILSWCYSSTTYILMSWTRRFWLLMNIWSWLRMLSHTSIKSLWWFCFFQCLWTHLMHLGCYLLLSLSFWHTLINKYIHQ